MPDDLKSDIFLCGCSKEKEKFYSLNLHKDTTTGNDYLSGQRFDSEGFEVCPEHGVRLSGWASPTVSTVNGDRIDWSSMGSKKKELNLNPKVTTDRRDTRDPQELGRAILTRSNGH